MKRLLVNATIVLAGLAAIAAEDRAQRTRNASRNARDLASAARSTAGALAAAVAVPVTATEDLQAFMLAPESLPDGETFDRFGRLLLERHPPVRAVQFVSPDRVIRRVYPLEGNESAMNLDLTGRPAHPFVEEAVAERRLTVNHPTVTVQGTLSIVPRAPLYRGEELLGLVQTLVEIDPVIELAREALDERFQGQLRDETGELFWGPETLGELTAGETVPVGDTFWTLTVGWRRAPPGPSLPALVLLWGGGGLGLLGVFLVANRTWLERRAEKQTRTLRAEAEERARAEERVRFQATTLDAVGSAVMASAPDGTVIYWNRAAQELYGWSPSEALGRNIVDLTPAEQSREEALEIMERLRAGESWRGEFLVRRKDGSSFPALVVDSPVLDASGELIAIIGVSNDLTERKRMEDALRETENLLRTVLRSAPITLFATDRYGIFTLSTGIGLESIGLEPGEYVGDSALELYGSMSYREENGAEISGTDVVRRALEGETITATNEVRGVHFINRVGPMLDAEGKIVGIVGVATDITEQKRAEDALRQRQRELESLLHIGRRLSEELDADELLSAVVESVVQTLPSAQAASLWLYDEDADRLAPHAWAGHRDEDFEDLSLSPDTTLVGRVFRDGEALLVGDTATEADFVALGRSGLDGVRSAIGAPLRVRERVVGALFADNATWAEAFSDSDLLVLEALAAQAGAALGNASLFDEVHRGRERVRALATRLAASEEEERRRLSKKLHDQVSPGLAAVGLNLELLRNRLELDPPETSKGRLTVAQETVADVTERIRDVMTELHPPVLEDYGLVAALGWHAERLGVGAGLEVAIEGEELDPPLPLAKAMSLLRISQEALTNVVKHSGVRRARVTVESGKNVLRLTIADEGAGFDPSGLATAAEVHWGLLTMRERAEALGGGLRVESAPGAGTRVVVEVPR